MKLSNQDINALLVLFEQVSDIICHAPDDIQETLSRLKDRLQKTTVTNNNDPDSIQGGNSQFLIEIEDVVNHKMFISHLVISILSPTQKTGEFQEVLDRSKANGHPGAIDCRVLLNGLEFPLKEFSDRLEKAWEREIQKEAAKKISDKFQDKHFAIQEKLGRIQEELEDLLQEEFPNYQP